MGIEPTTIALQSYSYAAAPRQNKNKTITKYYLIKKIKCIPSIKNWLTQSVTTVTQFVPVQVPNKVIGQLKSHTVQGSSQRVKSIDCSNSPPGAAPNYWFGPELLNVTIFLNKPRLLLYWSLLSRKTISPYVLE